VAEVPSFVIEVGSKAGAADPSARGLLSDIRHLGVRGVKAVESSQLYRLSGDIAAGDRARIANDLLCDPIIQDWAEESRNPLAEKSRPVRLDVWFKQGVTDVVGDSVRKGILDLGISGVDAVRTGTRYRFWGLPNREAAERIADAYLANSLVQEHFSHVDS